MPASTTEFPKPPEHIARQLPRFDLLREALLNSTFAVPAGVPLVRAAWNRASIFPARVHLTHRFGPPSAYLRDGSFPFHWIYAATDVMTSVWEAGFCRNDVTEPGTFYIAHGAREALLATLRFKVALVLFDLSGLTLSKLGLFDEISNPDHERSQWLGCMIDDVLADATGRIHGFRYPSRKHRGHEAVAISSRHVEALAQQLAVSHEPFGPTSVCAALSKDPCCMAPPSA